MPDQEPAARGHCLTFDTLWTLEARRAEGESLAEMEALGVRLIAERLPRWHCLLCLLTVVHTPIHLLPWPLIRYRLPVDAGLIVFPSPRRDNMVG